MIDNKLSELKAAAEKATPGEWGAENNVVWIMSGGTADSVLLHTNGDETSEQQDNDNAKFIAAANPAVVLALLAELKMKEEQRHNWYLMAEKISDEMDAANKHIVELEARLATPVRWPNEKAASAMFDIFYQTERNNHGNVIMGYSDARELGEWIAKLLQLRTTGFKYEEGQ